MENNRGPKTEPWGMPAAARFRQKQYITVIVVYKVMNYDYFIGSRTTVQASKKTVLRLAGDDIEFDCEASPGFVSMPPSRRSTAANTPW